mmetsp:Transcript_8356/g.16900  ORF Transcript_8356/g.16900 Transcript_8356/m.16900 type:complete len:225 (+) Transcript_8356:227-901(+)
MHCTTVRMRRRPRAPWSPVPSEQTPSYHRRPLAQWRLLRPLYPSCLRLLTSLSELDGLEIRKSAPTAIDKPAPNIISLENARYEDSWHLLLILFPIGAVFDGAHMIITERPMDEEHGKIDSIKVGERRRPTAREAPSQSHHPVTSVVDLACQPPPSSNEQLGAALRVEELQVRHLGAVWVSSESIFLRIGAAEYCIAEHIEGRDGDQCHAGQTRIMVHEDARLQ